MNRAAATLGARSGLATAVVMAMVALLLAPAVAGAAAVRVGAVAAPTGTGSVAFGLVPEAYAEDVLAAAALLGDVVPGPLGAAGVYEVRPRDIGSSSLRSALSRIDGIQWVEPERAVHALAAPNDPRFWDQYSLEMMQVARAWETSPGSARITVAVVDSGVGPHPDLDGRLLAGHSLLESGSPTDVFDRNGHGTAVSGIIAGRVHDRLGHAGVSQRVRILPVVALDGDGVGTDVGAGNAIVWAVDNGADVVNVSLGGQWASTALRSAVRYAQAHGVVVVAAVGNDGEEAVRYPAAFPEVIAVGAVGRDSAPLASSNRGQEVDIAAPGSGVLSSGWMDSSHRAPTTQSFTGTSFSAAYVTGVAALLLSKDPTLTPQRVQQLLEQGARDVAEPGWDDVSGWGVVDASASLALLVGAPIQGDVTAPRPPLEVVVSAAADGVSLDVRVDFAAADDRTGVVVRRTTVRPARAPSDGALVGELQTGAALTARAVDPATGLVTGDVYYYTAFSVDAAGNTSNPTWDDWQMGFGRPGLPPAPTMTPTFRDVPPGHPFYDAISVLAASGVVSGFSDGTFQPDVPVARAQLAKMVVLATAVPLPDPDVPATFADVPAGEGYPFVHVEAAAAAGIVKGFGAVEPGGRPLFGPYRQVSRIQVAQMLARAGGEKLDYPPAGILHPFYDTPDYADSEVLRVWEMEIVKGRAASAFDPWSPATRGQVAAMLYRLMSVLQSRP